MADLDWDATGKITCVYLLGMFAFLCGSGLKTFFAPAATRETKPRALRLFKLSRSFWVLCFATIAVFAISKALLIPLGVYSDYAFDTGNMTGGVWSFSMFCSESLLFLSIIVLFSNARRRVGWFLAFTAVNGINLLHGTRMMFMVASIAFCFYLYVRGKLNFRIAVLAFCSTLALGYLVFLSRSHIEVDDQTFSFARIITPIMYESVFSQLSLFETIKNPHLWNFGGAPHNFFLDTLYFLTPRFLLPGKDEMLFINRFSDLARQGAICGYTQGLIYFGVFFPLFYFVVGVVASWLLRHARDSQFWSMIYVYFVCDCLFRLMRDGYVIPIKVMINGLAILAIVAFLQPRTNSAQAHLPLPAESKGFTTA